MSRARSYANRVLSGLVLLVALAGFVIWLLARDSSAKGADIASVLGLPIALIGLALDVKNLLPWARQTAGQRPEHEPELRDVVRQAAAAVRANEMQTMAQLLGASGEAMPAVPSLTVVGREDGRSDTAHSALVTGDIGDLYCRLVRGRLVILGDSGAGKTVLAVQLACELTRRAVIDDASNELILVPIRASVANFDLGANADDIEAIEPAEVARRLNAWVARRLAVVAELTPARAAELVQAGRVVAVLDGLDEMDPPQDRTARRARAVLAALNEFDRGSGGLRRVVVTCRTDRYRQLAGSAPDDSGWSFTDSATVLANAETVVVQPLHVRDVAGFLKRRFPRGSDRWQPVFLRLHQNLPDDILVKALSSPLRLFLATTGAGTPQDRSEHELPASLAAAASPESLDDLLFTRFIAAVATRRPGAESRLYQADDVRRWLSRFARHLGGRGSTRAAATDLRVDELWSVAGRVLVGPVTGLLMAVAALTIFFSGPRFFTVTSPAALETSSLAQIAVVLAIGASFLNLGAPRRFDLGALRRPGVARRVLRRLVAGALAGYAFGAVVGTVLSLVQTRDLTTDAVRPSAETFMLLGVVLAVVRGLEVRPAITGARRFVAQGVAYCIVSVVGCAALGVLWTVMGGGGIEGLMVGVWAGLLGGLVVVAWTSWPRYAVGCMVGWLFGASPPRPALFLDWACEAGLLRQSGEAFQFRHREFQLWLASETSPAQRTVRAAPLDPGRTA